MPGGGASRLNTAEAFCESSAGEHSQGVGGKGPHSMMQRGPVDKGEQESCKLEEGIRAFSSSFSSSSPLLLPWTERR